jgi:acyl-CoA hydrolase
MQIVTDFKTIEDILKTYDTVVVGMAASEPQYFISHLKDIKKHITIINCLALHPYAFNEHIQIKSLFYSSVLRQHPNTHIQYVPTHLRNASKLITTQYKPFIFVGSASLVDHEGYVSLSLSNVYEYEAFMHADVKILELSPHMPKTSGNHKVLYTDIDYVIHTDNIPYTLPQSKVDPRDKIIGKLIADQIEDGSTLQFGIGAIPNEVAHHLVHKKDLGIHTEMFSDGFMELIKSKAANGLKKVSHQGKHVCSFALGSLELYKFLDNNKDVEFYNASYVNDPSEIAKNPKQVSINTTIEIDLSGQCNSETLRGQHYSGTGGQTDTAIGAQMSLGGKSFIALHSTSQIKTEDGHVKTISKIVSKFKNGTSVSLSRNDIDFVATEFGIVKLKGLSLKERAEKLISIAHPDFRVQLEEEFKSQI